MPDTSPRDSVAARLAASPLIGVVRSDSLEHASRIADLYLEAGLGLVEITFTVPEATALVKRLKGSAAASDAAIGMGTVTTRDRARRAVAAGADFIVSPNVHAGVAEVARAAELYLILGGLTCTEIVKARELGADLVKVYPLAPVGGPAYLEIVRQPLGDVPMLAAGGFGIEEIPSYRAAGATAFGLGPPLLGASDRESTARIQRALELARPGSPS
jgi:2-dehydro-3-deoxyphosphogluconate aldolase/(4S)-4-hydroxy-2-oxoglutarate aldolase